MVDVFRQEYRELGADNVALIDDIKEQAQKLHDLIGRAESVGTAGDDVQRAQAKLIDAVMWAVRAVSA